MGLFDRFRKAGEPPPLPTIDNQQEAIRLIDKGNRLEEGGSIQEAMDLYETAIKMAPKLARAHLNRGNILLATNKADEALNSYTTALALDPEYFAAYYNSGNAYVHLKRHQDALAAYTKAIELKPDFADAHVAKGCLFEDMDRLDDAISSYRLALAINPNYPEVYCNQASVLMRQGRVDEAIESYQRALNINPRLINALINLGDLQRQLRKYDLAITNLRKAVELNSSDEKALSCLGMALKEDGHFNDALVVFKKALKANPRHVDALLYLGDIYRDIGQPTQALESYQQVITLEPEHAIGHCNLGNALLDHGRLLDAITCYRRAIELQPNFAAAHSNLGSVLKDIGHTDESLKSFRCALDLMPGLTPTHSNLLFLHNSLQDLKATELLAEAKRYGNTVATIARPFATWKCPPIVDRRLRVGFVSNDFRNHPVGHFIEGVFQSISKLCVDSIELHAYPVHHVNDAISERIRASCKAWHPVATFSNEELARKIHEDGIDILIDLSGHTAENRLPAFAWKPAPIQATWLGYLGTTGVSAIDYLIADEWTLPESETVNFTEKIWRLPESYVCFTPPTANTMVSLLPAIKNGYVTFGSFNNLTKVTDDVVALWARLLKEIPESRLYLKTKQLAEASVQQSVTERFSIHGITPERLILSAQVPRDEYLEPFQKIDIALDPFPYTGITTTVETLWMGVPVLTLSGTSFLSRQGVGLLTNAGLPDWIAETPEDYVIKARTYARDLEKLSQIRNTLRQRVKDSPIFNSQRFAYHFETALRDMWKIWCNSAEDASGSEYLRSSPHSIQRPPLDWTTINPNNRLQQVQYVATPALASKQGLWLHIGGKQPKDGWKILNSQNFQGVDYVGDVRDLSAFDDGSCEKIYASHVMEHVAQKDFLPTLKGIHRILCNRGKFYLSVPDLEELSRLMTDSKLDTAQKYHVMRMIFGGQQDKFDFHFIGLTADFMMDFFKQAGFSQVERTTSLGLFKDTSDYSPYGSPISLNMIATK